MLTLKIIWCKIGEVFWGCIANITAKLASLFEPDWETLEKILEQKNGGSDMNVSKAEYNCLKTMTDDLMEAEYFINNLGVETRTDEAGDEFRHMADIIKDIVTVCNNNPTIVDDCVEFLATNPTTSDESDAFQSKYNLNGIYKIQS